MPVLSMHNTYTLPSGSASYTLGLSGAPGAASYTLPTVGTATGTGFSSSLLGGTSNVTGGLSGFAGTGLSGTGYSNILGGTTGLSSGIGGLTSTGLSALTGTSCLGGVTGLTGTGLSHTLSTNLGLGTNASYSTYTNPLLTSGITSKLKTLDDIDLTLSRYRARSSPCSPIPPMAWELDHYGLEGVNPAFMHSQSRPISRIGLDLDSKYTKKQFQYILYGCCNQQLLTIL